MLTLSSPDFTEIELVPGYQVNCNNCTDTLFIQRKHRSVITSITECLSRSGWQKAVNDNEYFVCVCQKCVKKLQENEIQSRNWIMSLTTPEVKA